MRGDCWGKWLIMLGFMDLGWPRVSRRSTSVLFFLIFLIVFLSRGVLSFLFFFHWHNYTVFLRIPSPQPFGICFWRSPTVHFHLRDTSRILLIWYFLCSHLTHWGRVTHIYICVNNLTIIGSDNGLSPGRRQDIIWTNDGILLIWPLRTNFSEILGEIYAFSFKKMCLKMSSAKWRQFCLGLNVLKHCNHLFHIAPWFWWPHVLFDMVWASYQIHKIAGCACAGNARFFHATDFKGNH